MSFFSNLFNKPKSGQMAKERLKLVLIHDRVKLSPGMLDLMRDEIIEVISKYVDIDMEGINLSLDNTTNQNRLVADIPIRAAKRKGR